LTGCKQKHHPRLILKETEAAPEKRGKIGDQIPSLEDKSIKRKTEYKKKKPLGRKQQ